MTKEKKILFSGLSACIISIPLFISGVVSLTLGLDDNQKQETSVSEISVFLDENSYDGKILRDEKKYNLTKELRKFPDFTGYTTNKKYTRFLNAVELRGRDKLNIEVPTNIIDNWTDTIKWVDTLSVKSFPEQFVEFKKISSDKWSSTESISYVNTLDIPKEVRGNSKSCFSKDFYDSLSSQSKQQMEDNLVEFGKIKDLDNTHFTVNPDGTYSKQFEKLNDKGWTSMTSTGVTSFFPCLQKIKEGSIVVTKTTNNSLVLEYKAFSDYSFLEGGDVYPKIENYSYLQKIEGEKKEFLTGLIFSNLKSIKGYTSDDFSTYGDSIGKTSGTLYKRVNTDGVFTYEDSNYATQIKEEIEPGGSSFKSKKLSFAGLYSNEQDKVTSKFWDWYISDPLIIST